jgi:hypothetical protein
VERIFDFASFPDEWGKSLLKEFPRPGNSPVGPLPRPNAFIPVVRGKDPFNPSDGDYTTIIDHLLTATYASANFLAQTIPTDHPDYIRLSQEQSLAQIGMTGIGLAVQQLMLWRKSMWLCKGACPERWFDLLSLTLQRISTNTLRVATNICP